MDLIFKGFVSGYISSLICHPLEFLKVNYQVKNKSNIKFSKGIFINPLCYGLHYSLYYPVYNKINNYFDNSFIAAFLSQNVVNLVLNPLWVIRTQRMTLDKTYTEILTNTRFGFYRSIIPNTLIGFQTGISFGIMEYLIKKDYNPIMSSCISKILAGVITYPVDTIRTISRVDNTTPIKDIYSSLTFFKMYRGLSFYLIKSVPSFVIVNYIFNKI